MSKKLPKSILALCLAAIMLCTMLAGCGQGPASATPETKTPEASASQEKSEQIVEIDFWHQYPNGASAEFMTSLLDQFMKDHPNIKVNQLGLSMAERSEKLTTALAAGTAPDLIANNLDDVQDRAAKGQIMNIQAYAEEYGLDLDKYFPDTVNSCKYEGELYGFPFITDTRVLFYNKDHFREAGLDPEKPPKTWEEVKEYNEKLTIVNENGEIERVGFSSRLGESYPWVMGWTFGAELWNEDGTPNMTSPEMLEALEYCVEIQEQVGLAAFDTLNEGLMSMGVDPFINETVSMSVKYNGMYSTIKEYNPNLDFGVALIPTKDGVHNKASWGSGFSLEICDKGDAARSRAAFELAMYLCSAEVGTSFVLNQSEYVCNMDAYNNEEIQADPVWQVFAESGKYTRLHHFCAALPTWHYGTLQPEWDAALIGAKTPEQALQDAQNNILAEMENYRLING